VKFIPLSLLSTALALTVACTPDRTFSGEPVPVPPPVGNATLLLNELVCGGSQQASEFGVKEDWIELYNPSSQPLAFAADEWFVTDDSTNRTKYPLPALTVASHGYLVIWCDGRNVVQTQVHTNFNLSRSGEAVGLYHRATEGGAAQPVDYYAYPDQSSSPDGSSLGRTTDGAGAWRLFPVATPGATNN
jgi:Lamin Tail Domain